MSRQERKQAVEDYQAKRAELERISKRDRAETDDYHAANRAVAGCREERAVLAALSQGRSFAMGLRAKFEQFRQEWADTPEPRPPKHTRPEPNGTCDQRGCSEPTYGHNGTCNRHIAGL